MEVTPPASPLDGEACVRGRDGGSTPCIGAGPSKRRRCKPSTGWSSRRGSAWAAAGRLQEAAEKVRGQAASWRAMPSEHTDEDGPLIFQQACEMGLEGIVSKRLNAPYRSGPSLD
jgi:hypothetical protein